MASSTLKNALTGLTAAGFAGGMYMFICDKMSSVNDFAEFDAEGDVTTKVRVHQSGLKVDSKADAYKG
jgi:hypothetical protein